MARSAKDRAEYLKRWFAEHSAERLAINRKYMEKTDGTTQR